MTRSPLNLWGLLGRGTNGNNPKPGTIRDSLMPLSEAFTSQEPREVDPHFYELLREAFPVLNTAIHKMITLDGVVKVECERDDQQRALDEFMEGVKVNDLLTGYQSWINALGNECYEQGCGFSEFYLGDKRHDGVAQLRVGDSKGIVFIRDQGVLRGFYCPPRAPKYGQGNKPLERVLRNQTGLTSSALTDYGYVELDLSRLQYIAYHPEADNPYGVSLLRAVSSDAEVLAHIKQAVKLTWQRFGDPSYIATFKSGVKRDDPALAKIEAAISQDLVNLITAKKNGKGGDLVRSIGNKDDLSIDILGAGGSEMDTEKPTKFILGQLVSGSELPGWMLGVEKPSQDAGREAEMALHESEQRFEARRAVYKQPLIADLRAKGITFDARDINLVQHLPNLTNVVANAQANFLNAQADMMRANGELTRSNTPGGESGGADSDVTVEEDSNGDKHMVLRFPVAGGKGADVKKTKAATGEWVDSDPRVPRLEKQTVSAVLATWQAAGKRLLTITDLTGKQGKAVGRKNEGQPLFTFTPEWLNEFEGLFQAFIDELTEGEQSALMGGVLQAAELGAMIGAADLSLDTATEAARQRATTAVHSQGLVNARKTATRVLRDEILTPLAEGAFNGQNVFDVARTLKRRFDNGETDFTLLAQTEIAQALAVGKQEQYLAEDIEEYDYLHANDEKVSAICRLHQQNNPHRVGQGPLPARDSHPGCRCTIAARVPGE